MFLLLPIIIDHAVLQVVKIMIMTTTCRNNDNDKYM